jgi:hypothetical protein
LFCFAEKKKTVFVAFEEKKSCCVLGEESLRKIDRRKICANRNPKKSLFLQERKKERSHVHNYFFPIICCLFIEDGGAKIEIKMKLK